MAKIASVETVNIYVWGGYHGPEEDMMMQVYEGRLRFHRATKKMLVYGDDVLKAQYIPKALLSKKRNQDFPQELNFVISAGEPKADRDGTGTRSKRNNPKAAKSSRP